MRAFAAAVLVLATLAAAPAGADDLYGGAVFYVYQRGTSTTKVDRIPAQKLDLYPVTLDAEFIHPEFYIEIAADWLGQEFFVVMPDSWYADPDNYGKDEATFNLKVGMFNDEKAATTWGYGFELDTRTHTYAETLGGPFTGKEFDKVRVGLGPNLAFRTGISWLFTAPNVSLFYYPWPNEESAFIPKGKAGWGYRVEVPIYLDVADLLGLKTWAIWVAAKPFYGWQGGFHRKDDSTGEKWNSEAKSTGIRFGFGIGRG